MFVDLENAFDRVPRRVMQWALKKGLPEIVVTALMSLYVGLKTKVEAGSQFLKQFYVAVGVHQRSVLSPLLFAIVLNVVTENASEGLMKEIVLNKDDLALISETIKGLKERFLKWKSVLE